MAPAQAQMNGHVGLSPTIPLAQCADAVFVKPPNGAEADRTRVKPGDLLLTITGSRIGRVAPVSERLNGAFISQHVAILRLKAGLLPEFLSMFLSLDAGGQREIARVHYGQTKPGLNLDQIRELRAPVPPFPATAGIRRPRRRNPRPPSQSSRNPPPLGRPLPIHAPPHLSR